MNESQLKQEELLQILLRALEKGERTTNMTTTDMIEDLITEIKKAYAS